MFYIALHVFYIALGGSVVYKYTTKRTAQLTKLNFIFAVQKNTLVESCSGENLTHDVRYQATIQRPMPNVSMTASRDLGQNIL